MPMTPNRPTSLSTFTLSSETPGIDFLRSAMTADSAMSAAAITFTAISLPSELTPVNSWVRVFGLEGMMITLIGGASGVSR